MAPESVSVPVPALVRSKPVPATPPLRVRMPAVIVSVRFAPSVAAPESVSALVPANAKSPFSASALATVRAAAEASSVPPVIVNVPVPSAAALPTLSVPAERVSPPVNVLAPESVTAPMLDFVAATPVPPRMAETVPA